MATHITSTSQGYVDGITFPKALGVILRGTKKPVCFKKGGIQARQWFLIDNIRALVEKVREHNAKSFVQPQALSRRNYPVLYKKEAPTHLFEQVYHSLSSTIGVASYSKEEFVDLLRRSVERIILASYKPEKKQRSNKKKALVSATQLKLFPT